jgi:hypothetical protein
MANPPASGLPLFTSFEFDVDPEVRTNLAFLGTFLATARFGPGLAGRSARFLTGTTKAAESAGGAVTFTPLAAGNVLPVPFGFAPPHIFGLSNDFFLPTPGPGAPDLPTLLPGGSEFNAKAAEARAAREAALQPALQSALAVAVSGLSTAELNALQSGGLTPAIGGVPIDAATLTPLVAAELGRRQAAAGAAAPTLAGSAPAIPPSAPTANAPVDGKALVNRIAQRVSGASPKFFDTVKTALSTDP